MIDNEQETRQKKTKEGDNSSVKEESPTPEKKRMSRQEQLQELQKSLNYQFRQTDLLEQALTHRSFVHESRKLAIHSYERLEFLGDAVLELVISHYLWDKYPTLPEGDLTRMRAELVKKMTLATLAQRLNLGQYLRLGRGERLAGGAERASILADTFEAMLAALYLEGGLSTVQQVCLHLFEPEMVRLDPSNLPNYKNRLQELAASLQLPQPVYELVTVEGPEHEPIFHMKVMLAPYTEALGKGATKKLATQEAAHQQLLLLQEKMDSVKEGILSLDTEEEKYVTEQIQKFLGEGDKYEPIR